MTQQHDGPSLLERWPGYDEQSWQERFGELDRRYRQLQDQTVAAVTHPTQPQAEGLVEEFRALCCSTPTIEQMGQWLSTRVDRLWAALRSPEPSEEMVEKVARAICRVNTEQRVRSLRTEEERAEAIECQVANGWDLWVPEARAALSSLSLPDR